MVKRKEKNRPTNCQIFGDASGQTCALILTMRHMQIPLSLPAVSMIFESCSYYMKKRTKQASDNILRCTVRPNAHHISGATNEKLAKTIKVWILSDLLFVSA